MADDKIYTAHDLTADLKLKADICVVGSGAGGAVAAKELAEAGAKVILLEEGPHRPSSTFTGNGLDMIKLLYRDFGFTASTSGTRIPIPLGRSIGGTTTINSGTALRTPDEVLRNWEKQHRLEGFSPEAMKPHFDRVAEVIHIERVPDELLGGTGRVVKRGVKQLGWKGDNLHRNELGCTGCGVCALGCPTDAKRSMLVTYVPLALKAGAYIQADARVQKINVTNNRALGVEGVILKNDKPKFSFKVDAPKVIISCGAIMTPALLLNNKLANSSGMLGENLRIHPALGAGAIFPEVLNGWNGIPQSYMIEEFVDDRITMEGAFTPPYITAVGLPFSGIRHKDLMAKYKHMAMFGSMVSDISSGSVSPRRKSINPKISYTLLDADKEMLVKSLKAICEVLFAGGARTVFPNLPFTPELHSVEELETAFKRDISVNELSISAFHPMGTARMGADKKTSVVDDKLQCHDVENLYIADGCVMPGSTRVNPQVSIMAFSTKAALEIAKQG